MRFHSLGREDGKQGKDEERERKGRREEEERRRKEKDKKVRTHKNIEYIS